MRIISGEAGGRRISAPAGTNTRPTLDRVRENLFNMLQGKVEGRTVLDLFAGSGALSLEALSRGAKEAVLVDCDRRAVAAEKQNIGTLGYGSRADVVCADWRQAVSGLARRGKRFDLVFLDPPYATHDLREVFDALVPLLETDALIVLEHEAGKKPETGGGFTYEKERNWGYCGVSFYRLRSERAEGEEE